MSKEIKTDISIVGAGVTGLTLANKFTDLGYRVALIEKQNVVGRGPSTKNEGWLHRGTYHATSIKNPEQAIAVARRCMYGHEQWRKFAPEAIEGIDTESFVFAKTDEMAHHAVTRWDRAGISYQLTTKEELLRNNPDIDTKHIQEIFKAGDVSINTRLLYQKLLTANRKGGTKILLGSTFHPEDSNTATISRDGENIKLFSERMIISAGYGMGDIYEEITGNDLPVRYWKSHLVVLPRLTQDNVFYLDPGEAALFNHGKNSVVGIHEDAIVEDHPTFDVIQGKERLVFEATTRLTPQAKRYRESYQAVACIKPDVAWNPEQARSLDIDVFRKDGVIFVLPGKMTEAPYVADRVVQEVFEESQIGDVALRPTDTYQY